MRRATRFCYLDNLEIIISIHALLAESDLGALWVLLIQIKNFYPRSPCGERPVTTVVVGPSRDFYPRSPCGERRITIITICTASKFLSTLSLRRATDMKMRMIRASKNFYPRSPCGERLPVSAGLQLIPLISIHALLAESDNPERAERHANSQFLSTLSLRRATAYLSILF